MARILFATTLRPFDWAGSEILWRNAAVELKRQGHDVAVCQPTAMRPATAMAPLRDAGITILQSPLDELRFQVSRVARRLSPTAADSVSVAAGHARAWKADVAVLSQAACWAGYRDMLALSVARIPYVSISQLNTPFVWPSERLFEVVGQAFAGARAAVFVSRGNLSLFENQIARSLPNAVVIYNQPSIAVDPPCAPRLVEPQLVLLNVARVDPAQKGQDLILDVMAMPKWRQRNVEVRIAGGGPRRWIDEAISAKSLANVAVLGKRQDLREQWEAADFGLFPSRYEGMPLAMIEGMALGRPIIATDVAGHAEWIEDGVNGFLAAGAEVRAIDAALERAWHARERASRMGESARFTYLKMASESPAQEIAALVATAAG